MQLEEQKNNKVVVGGIIDGDITFSHQSYGENFYNFKVIVPRLSSHFDVLPFTVSERIISKENLRSGTKVHIEGQIRSYNSFREEENKNKLVLTIFIKSIAILEEEENITNINDIYIDGYICKPPIYRKTPFGREIADMLVAVNRAYGKSDYIPTIAWGRNAKYSEKISVGENIKIFGRMQSREYEKKISETEKITKVAYEISVSKFEIATKNKTV